MIQFEHTVEFQNSYDLTRLGPQKDLLFFDIETTGFSGDSSQLYLIGCVFHDGKNWRMKQWFADTRESEGEVLDGFFQFMVNFKILVHFNGQGFDMPYLLKRCARLNRPWNFESMESIDIYRRIRPYKKLLGLESLKQKSIETFLGIQREDRFSGGQLIQVYEAYLSDGDPAKKELLLLHNREDLTGMPSILPILCYPDLLSGPLTLKSQHLNQGPSRNSSPWLNLQIQGSCPVPRDLEIKNDPAEFLICRDLLSCHIELYQGELKYFYPNYKDYYYLPYEDQAVHKSVGEFVDKHARKQATAKNCYTRRSGLFLPQFQEIWTPSLYQEYRSPMAYAEYSPQLLEEPGALHTYICRLLEYVQS